MFVPLPKRKVQARWAWPEGNCSCCYLKLVILNPIACKIAFRTPTLRAPSNLLPALCCWGARFVYDLDIPLIQGRVPFHKTAFELVKRVSQSKIPDGEVKEQLDKLVVGALVDLAFEFYPK